MASVTFRLQSEEMSAWFDCQADEANEFVF